MQKEQSVETQEQRDAVKMALDPFASYRKMRESDPVSYDEKNKIWSLFRYEDVLRVTSDYSTFSSEQVMTSERVIEGMRNEGVEEEDRLTESILSLDPPRHRQLRSLISQAFTPRSIAKLTPRITQITHEYLDKVADTATWMSFRISPTLCPSLSLRNCWGCRLKIVCSLSAGLMRL